MILPDGTFDIVVADPPWRFSSNSKAKPGRNAMRHYPCMTDNEIGAIPLESIMAKDALFFMWTTAPMLERSMNIVRVAWPGLEYVSQGVWWKLSRGTGYWFRNEHEIFLLYKRGKFVRPEAKAPFPGSVIDEYSKGHSRKPERLQDWIDFAYPDARKAELFARRERHGWTVAGNETQKFERSV